MTDHCGRLSIQFGLFQQNSLLHLAKKNAACGISALKLYRGMCLLIKVRRSRFTARLWIGSVLRIPDNVAGIDCKWDTVPISKYSESVFVKRSEHIQGSKECCFRMLAVIIVSDFCVCEKDFADNHRSVFRQLVSFCNEPSKSAVCLPSLTVSVCLRRKDIHGPFLMNNNEIDHTHSLT